MLCDQINMQLQTFADAPGCYYQLVLQKGGASAEFIEKSQKAAGLTQEEFAMHPVWGFALPVTGAEQKTVRLYKVNTDLAMFNMEAVPGRKRLNVFLNHLRG